jgi:hypothetical protein
MANQVAPKSPELPPGYLDLSKRMTDKRLGLPEAEQVRLIVYEYEEIHGDQCRMVYDILEGPRKWIVTWFNREREWWADRKCEVKVENVPAYNGGH